MQTRWFFTVCAVLASSYAASIEQGPPDRIGLDKPTDKPIQVSEYDIKNTLESAFPGMNAYPGSDGSARVVGGLSTPPPPLIQNSPELSGSDGTDQDTLGEDCECVPYYLCSTNRTIIEDGEGLIDIRMKTGPCEYLDVCCGQAQTLTPDEAITPSPPPQPLQSSCGQRNFNGVSSLRITGAQDSEAQFGEFPWMVAVIKKNVINVEQTQNIYQCGGSLINPQVVLTAAHCVKGKELLSVRVGEWDTQSKSEPLPTQNRNVREVVIHEQYYAGGLVNDIALLFLDSPVDLAPNVATICLPEQGESMVSRNCAASGWGKDVFGREGVYQVILKKVELPVVAWEACQESLRKTRLGRHFKLHPTFLCAGGVPGKDTCKGDGGGPLVCPTTDNPDVYVQAGIIAWGIGCGTETPGVYVDVAQFRDWIESKMNMYNFDIRNVNGIKSTP